MRFGLLVLLIAVFPANIYLFTSEIAQNTFGISKLIYAIEKAGTFSLLTLCALIDILKI